MSGIVGIVSRSGEPVSRTLLQAMTESMAGRGPDRQAVWNEDRVGLGHTLLATTDESFDERLPGTLDDKVWITADARIDDRQRLIGELKALGQTVAGDVTDPDLILRAYAAWGEACVDHLLGDFAFAIWDSEARKLFCARDHFGVKPFFYARPRQTLVFSNTLNCVRVHPSISDELDDLAVADFLLFRGFQDLDRTIYRDIHRLPPAHVLVYDGETLRVSCYWKLSIGPEVRYRTPSEYVERFRHVLQLAVGDRLRTNRVGVLLSGGLDASSIAATAKSLLAASPSSSLSGFTAVYDSLIPDEERHYSTLVAEALGIPVRFHAADGYRLYERWDSPDIRNCPEPVHHPLAMLYADHLKSVAQYGRVALTGWDGDALFRESAKYYFPTLLREGHVGTCALALLKYCATQRKPPFLGIRTALKQRLGLLAPEPESEFPRWLNPELVSRFSLQSRWKSVMSRLPGESRRPTLLFQLTAASWPGLFDEYDPGVTGLPLELRHPLMDLRVVQFAQSLPVVPWCINKTIVREAMRGVLPEAVRLRPKAPLAGNPMAELLRLGPRGWDTSSGRYDFRVGTRIMSYLAGEPISRQMSADEPLQLSIAGFDFWLQHQQTKGPSS